MTNEGSAEDWNDWNRIQKEAFRAWSEGNLADAISMVNKCLEKLTAADARRQAIAFRGELHEELGDIAAARADLSTAHQLTERADYERYTLEIALAGIAKSLGDLGVAELWYGKALETAAIDCTTSGGAALRRLLELRGERGLTEVELQIAKKVVHQAWNLLRLEGEPNCQDMLEAAMTILKAQRKAFSAENPPSPKAFDG